MSHGNANGLHHDLKEINRTFRDFRTLFRNVGGTAREIANTTADVTHVGSQARTRGNRYESREIRSESNINNAATGNINSQGKLIDAQNKFDAKYGNEPSGAGNDNRAYFANGYQPPQAPDLSRRDQRNFNNLVDTQAQLAALKNDAIDDEKQQIDIKKLEGDKSFYRDRISDKGLAQVTQYEADNLKFQQNSADRETASARFDQHMREAFIAPVGSQARNEALAAALADARALQNPQGTGVTFPDSARDFLPQQEARPEASNRRGHHTAPAPLQNPLAFGSPEAAMRATSSALVASGAVGNAVTEAELKNIVLGVQTPPTQTNAPANNGAGTNTPNTGTNSPTGNGADAGTQNPGNNNASAQDAAGNFPALTGALVKGTHSTHAFVPKMDATQVGALQEMLAAGAGEKAQALKAALASGKGSFGPRTMAALIEATGLSKDEIHKLDFSNGIPAEIAGKLGAASSSSKVDETPEQKQDIADNTPQPSEHGPNPPAGNANADITNKTAPQPPASVEVELKAVAEKQVAAQIAASPADTHNFLVQAGSILGFDNKNGTDAELTVRLEQKLGVASNKTLEANEILLAEQMMKTSTTSTRKTTPMFDNKVEDAIADLKTQNLPYETNAAGPNGIPNGGQVPQTKAAGVSQ